MKHIDRFFAGLFLLVILFIVAWIAFGGWLIMPYINFLYTGTAIIGIILIAYGLGCLLEEKEQNEYRR